ncbi:MAG: helix-turn-helix transcriptional regulator [Ruminococcus sp.]|nr:helix-turn-helix transcriptional regulator [Ruminococcus sp.]
MEKQTTLDERFGKCPYATAQSLISGKWSVLILLYLQDGPLRFNELLRKMPKMTHATLSVQLKSLEENGLIRRVQYEAIPPRVEYSLTEIGERFQPVVAALETWGNEYIDYLKQRNA